MRIKHAAGSSIGLWSLERKNAEIVLSCFVSKLSDMGMPAVVLNNPEIKRGIWVVNQVIDQLVEVAETCIGTSD